MEEERDRTSEAGARVGSPSDFSIVLGGPYHRFCVRTGLMRPPLGNLPRRIVAAILITWVPLALISLADGVATGGVTAPFFHHLAVHVRFLASVPLLIGAELIIHQRLRWVVEQFGERGLVAPEDQSKFDAALASALRLRNSPIPEIALLVFAWTVGYWLWSEHVSLPVDTWYGRQTESGRHLTPAGYWYAFVSLPLFRFILCRWYFRIAIWYRFLWKVSRLHLRLNPLHPDRAAGLSFLSGSLPAFAPILVAHTMALTGLIGDQLLHRGAKLPQFRWEIGILVVLLLMVAAFPLSFFQAGLIRARREGLRAFGALASRYVEDFRRKWLSPSGPGPRSPLGSGDFQSLADLSNSFDGVRQLRPFPFDKRIFVLVTVVTILPLLPLVLTMIPLEQMIGRLLKVIV